MSLLSIAQMSQSLSLQARIAACAATVDLGGLPPVQWAQGNMLTLVATDGWGDAWDAAPAYNPDGTVSDKGATDTITDTQIIAAVTALAQAQADARAAAQQPAGGSGAGA